MNRGIIEAIMTRGKEACMTSQSRCMYDLGHEWNYDRGNRGNDAHGHVGNYTRGMEAIISGPLRQL